MPHPRLALALSSLALAATSAAQLPLGDTLIKDVKPGETPIGLDSHPSRLVEAPGFTLFSASAPGIGIEPWVTDGTSAGTVSLGDLNPFGSSIETQSAPQGAVVPGGAVFAAWSDSTGRELWRTDGTPQGTALLKDIQPGGGFSHPLHFCSLGGVVHFLATGPMGRSVWRTDGTAAGTQIAVAIDVGAGSQLVSAEGRLWIWDAPFTQDPDLYVSDGTTAGTRFVGSFEGFLTSLDTQAKGVGVNGRLVFGLRGAFPYATSGVWSTDGTPGGTVKLTAAAEVRWIERLGDKVVYAVEEAFGIKNLYVTDGTPPGTSLLAQVSVPPVLTNPPDERRPARVGDALVFAGASASAHGIELWRTDGTAAGTHELVDILPGTGSSDPQGLIAHNGVAYFSAFDLVHGRELWRTDGTVAGTHVVLELAAGATGVAFDGARSFMSTPAGLSFAATHAGDGKEPYVTDGTAAGTVFLKDILPEPPIGSEIELLTRVGERVVFAARDGVHGRELWSSDGTAGGTKLVLDLAPGGTQDGGPTEMVSLGHVAIFAGGPASNREMWATDGTPAGTFQLGEIHPAGSSQAEQLTVAGDVVFFVADDGVHGFELWVTDGTVAGTRLVEDGWPYVTSPSSNKPDLLGATDDQVFYLWRTSGDLLAGDTGYELFVSDGTEAGTHIVDDLTPGAGSTAIHFYQPFGDLFAFTHQDPVFGSEVCFTDGTAAGTHVIDVNPGGSSLPGQYSRVGDLVLFTASDGTGTSGLFASDGTPAGTRKVLAQSQVAPEPLAPMWGDIAAGKLAWFRIGSGAGPQQLWRTDGTAAGTLQVHDYDLSFGGVFTVAEVGAEGYAVFTGSDAAGKELWLAAPAGPALALTDSNPGPAGSLPRDPVRAGSRLFFVADDGAHGEELHAVPLAATGTFDVAPYGAGCAAGEPAALDASGDLSVGKQATIELAGAPPGALAPLFFSAAPAAYALGGGCTGFLAAPKHLATFVASGAGGASLPVVVPAQPALAGATIYLQAVVVVPGGPFLGTLELSSALELVLGP